MNVRVCWVPAMLALRFFRQGNVFCCLESVTRLEGKEFEAYPSESSAHLPAWQHLNWSVLRPVHFQVQDESEQSSALGVPASSAPPPRLLRGDGFGLPRLSCVFPPGLRPFLGVALRADREDGALSSGLLSACRLLPLLQQVRQREERQRRRAVYGAGSLRGFQLLPFLQGAQ